MQIILGLVAILGGLAFWWWRIKMISEATSEIGDVAGRAWGRYKRNRFRMKVEDSPVESVDDPAVAAVVMLLTLVKELRPLNDLDERLIRQEIVDEMKLAKPDELMIFSKWVASHVTDASNVAIRYAKLWTGSLDSSERKSLVEMAERIVHRTGGPNARQTLCISKLRERLGLMN
jgi:hypothetical protein